MSLERQNLLTDLLADDDPAFRQGLLEQTLAAARARRRARQAQRAVALALVAGLAWFARNPAPPAPAPALPPRPVAVARGCPVINSRPLPADLLVATQPLDLSQLLATGAFAGVVADPPHDGQYHVIDDAQLLALAGPTAALVAAGTGDAQLLFLPAPEAAPAR